MRVLIVYGTRYGQAGKVAEYLAGVMRDRGHEARTLEIRSGAPRLDGADAVIVGASVQMGKHQERVADFVRRNRAALERMPAAFFSVSIAAHDNPGGPEVRSAVDRFIKETGWRPKRIGIFAGALPYTQYDPITRWVMKQIARSKGNRDTDASRDHAYTDWDDVRRFGEAFAASIAVAPATTR